MNQKTIEINPSYFDCVEDESKVLLLYGGAGSGKSFFAAQKLVLRFIHEDGHKFLILRKQSVNIKESTWSLILLVLNLFEFKNLTINKSDRLIVNNFNGNKMLFTGLDEPEKIKSIVGISGMWLEEATEFSFDDFTQLLLRIRGKHKNYIQYILTFNPISEYHWLKRKILDKIDTLESYRYVHTTYKDNKFLTSKDREQLEELKYNNPLYYQIYCLGDWGVEDKTGKFAYAFDEAIHIKKGLEVNSSEYVYLSFDFNVNPICCAVIQHYDDKVKVLQLIKLDNSDIHAMCDYIKVKYRKMMYIVTGDATGQNRSALTKDNMNYYHIIKDKLGLIDTQIQVPSANPPMSENKVLVNTILQVYDVEIDEVMADALIFDLKYVEVTQDNKIKKFNRDDDKQKADALDCFRYFCNTFMKPYIMSK